MTDPSRPSQFQAPVGMQMKPFPASTKAAHGLVDGIVTSVMCVRFSDRTVVTIVQDKMGISQWVNVPGSGSMTSLMAGFGGIIEETDTRSPYDDAPDDLAQDNQAVKPLQTPLSLLPSIASIPPAESVLGGGDFDRDVGSHFISRQIAALLRSSGSGDGLPVIVGIGWGDKAGIDPGPGGIPTREALVELILQALGG